MSSTLASITRIPAKLAGNLQVDTEAQHFAEVSAVSGKTLTLDLDSGISLRVTNDSEDKELQSLAVGAIIYYNAEGEFSGKVKPAPEPIKKVARHTSSGSMERPRNF